MDTLGKFGVDEELPKTLDEIPPFRSLPVFSEQTDESVDLIANWLQCTNVNAAVASEMLFEGNEQGGLSGPFPTDINRNICQLCLEKVAGLDEIVVQSRTLVLRDWLAKRYVTEN